MYDLPLHCIEYTILWRFLKNRIFRGTDGQQFHPMIKAGEELWLFEPDLCRSIPVTQVEISYYFCSTFPDGGGWHWRHIHLPLRGRLKCVQHKQPPQLLLLSQGKSTHFILIENVPSVRYKEDSGSNGQMDKEWSISYNFHLMNWMSPTQAAKCAIENRSNDTWDLSNCRPPSHPIACKDGLFSTLGCQVRT